MFGMIFKPQNKSLRHFLSFRNKLTLLPLKTYVQKLAQSAANGSAPLLRHNAHLQEKIAHTGERQQVKVQFTVRIVACPLCNHLRLHHTRFQWVPLHGVHGFFRVEPQTHITLRSRIMAFVCGAALRETALSCRLLDQNRDPQ